MVARRLWEPKAAGSSPAAPTSSPIDVVDAPGQAQVPSLACARVMDLRAVLERPTKALQAPALIRR